jgi:hypothetical protein
LLPGARVQWPNGAMESLPAARIIAKMKGLSCGPHRTRPMRPSSCGVCSLQADNRRNESRVPTVRQRQACSRFRAKWRRFETAFHCGLDVAVAWPLAAQTQQPPLPVIGFVHGGSANASADGLRAFREGLSETATWRASLGSDAVLQRQHHRIRRKMRLDGSRTAFGVGGLHAKEHELRALHRAPFGASKDPNVFVEGLRFEPEPLTLTASTCSARPICTTSCPAHASLKP